MSEPNDRQPHDPTEISHWRPLRRLLDAMDDDIARLYERLDVRGVRPRHTMPLIRLSRHGPMTIRQLAQSLEVTHSAMSQTVSALRAEGLVATRPGADARTREVTLTDKGRQLVPFIEAEWRATEDAVAELDDEIPYALTRVVRDIERALAREPFRERIARRLRSVPQPPQQPTQ